MGLLAGGLGAAWWVRDNVLWAPPQVGFGMERSSGWIAYDEPRAAVPTVAVDLGGRSVRALIDSGAQYSVIDRALFERLGRTDTFDLPLVAYGVSGQPQLGKGTTLELGVGEMRLSGLRTAILSLGPLADETGLGAPLILGRDVLSTVVLDIDAEARRLRMVARDVFRRPAQLIPVTVHRQGGDSLVTEVTVEGATIQAVVDTGASALLALSEEAANAAGLLDGRPQQQGSSIVLGGAMSSRIVEARTVTIGDALYRQVPLPIYGDVVLPGFPSALLGMEAFTGQRMVLDLAGGTLHISRAMDITVGQGRV